MVCGGMVVVAWLGSGGEGWGVRKPNPKSDGAGNLGGVCNLPTPNPFSKKNESKKNTHKKFG